VASIVTDTGLDGAIVLALRGTEATQAHDSVEVWDRTTVEQAVGALVVDGHLDEVGHADDIGPSPVDTDPATGPTAEADEEPTREPAPDPAATGPATDTASSQPDGEGPQPETATTARDPDRRQPSEDTASPSPEPDASPAAAAGPAEDAEAFVSGAAIEPQIDEAEARRTAQEAVFEAHEARLELLPFRVYRYRAQLEGDGHTREEDGRVWVSTQSGAVVRAPRGDRVDEIDPPHERFQGSLPAKDTEQAAREHLLDTLERREELRQEYSESAVIERVLLEPEPGSLELERLGKAFAPRWRIEGSNGTVFVDAVTGELVQS
jgi:hypothetical protein